MTIVEYKWSALPMPHVIKVVDRTPTQCHGDADFDAMEAQLPWPWAGHLACRLED